MADRTYGLFEIDTNKRLIGQLRERQADLRLFPEVTAIPPRIEPLFDLARYDWIVFPDLSSVDFFLANITEKFVLDELKVCALGDSVSDRLRFSRIHADVIPSDRQTGTVFSSLASYESISGLDFLIPARLGDTPDISRVLRENGATVELLPVYEIADIRGAPQIRTLLKSGAVDEFIFTSPQDVFSLAYFIEPIEAELKALATDEITLNTLREFGLMPVMYK